jgi:hypothetical protein
MRESLLEVLMRRDEMTKEEALAAIAECREAAVEMMENGEDPSDICEEFFGLEPDYLDDLLFYIT